MPDEGETTRREFLNTAIKMGLAICAGGMIVPAALYLWPARRRGPREAFVSAGSTRDFLPKTARLIQAEGRPIIVLALGDDKFRAFSAICTHLGCIVKWDEAGGKIACPCHGGFFGTDGRVLAGPPPRPLPEYEVRVGEDKELKVKL